jgi:hypothetical protein
MSEAVQWRLEGDVPHLACGPLKGQFNSSWARLFQLARWNGKPIESFFVLSPGLGVGKVRESYIRGNDYIETFEPAPPDDIVRQLYWRAALHAEPKAVQLELVISLQTDFFDRNLESEVYSSITGTRAFHSASLAADQFKELDKQPHQHIEHLFNRSEGPEHIFVFRHEAHNLSFAQMVHPSDFVRIRLVQDEFEGWNLISGMFPERLEKGVIRRGRICGWFLPAENDLEVAVELAKRFIDEPLPLTA